MTLIKNCTGDFRGQGLGLALICASILELKSRGLKGCFVDWVDITEFEGTYKQLGTCPHLRWVYLTDLIRTGFQPWGTYKEAWRRI